MFSFFPPFFLDFSTDENINKTIKLQRISWIISTQFV